MKPNADGTLTVLGRTLTTREVEQLMHDLAEARNLMEPQVPVDISGSTVNIVIQQDADVAVSLTASEEVAFACRHRGYGWLLCSFPPEKARFIAMAILKRANGETLDLGGQDDGKRH